MTARARSIPPPPRLVPTHPPPPPSRPAPPRSAPPASRPVPAAPQAVAPPPPLVPSIGGAQAGLWDEHAPVVHQVRDLVPPASVSPVAQSVSPKPRPARRRTSRLATVLVTLSALAGATVVLYRNDVLLDASRRAGREADFLKLESAVFGTPGPSTPRGVAAMFAPPPEAPAVAGKPGPEERATDTVGEKADTAEPRAAAASAAAAEEPESTDGDAPPREASSVAAAPQAAPRTVPRAATPARTATRAAKPEVSKASDAAPEPGGGPAVPVVTLDDEAPEAADDTPKKGKKGKANDEAEPAPKDPPAIKESGAGSSLDDAIRAAVLSGGTKKKKKKKAESADE